jgi:hypothetical protein
MTEVNLYTFLKLALYEGGQIHDSIVLSPKQKVSLSFNHVLTISRPISDSWLSRKLLHLILLWWIINFNANMKLDFTVNLVYEYAGYLESPHQTCHKPCLMHAHEPQTLLEHRELCTKTYDKFYKFWVFLIFKCYKQFTFLFVI